MNILYIADSHCFHTAVWVKYFCESEEHRVYLFSDQAKYTNPVNYPANVTKFQPFGVCRYVFGNWARRFLSVRHIDQILSVSKYRKEIGKVIEENEIEIIHCHSLYYGYLASGISDCRIPLIFTPQGSDIIIYAQRHWFYRRIARLAYARANVVTGDSRVIQHMGIKFGASPHNNFIIQNGVDQTLFYPKASAVRDRLGVDEGIPLLLSPRGLVDIYNIDVIISALSQLRKQGVEFRCMLTYPFGEEDKSRLVRLAERLSIADWLIWIGYVDYTQMPDYYNASDIVISVPITDSSPKSVQEAMSCRRPVIVSQLPWSSEFLVDGEDFVGVPVGSSESIASGVASLLENSELRERIAESGYQKAKSCWAPAAHTGVE